MMRKNPLSDWIRWACESGLDTCFLDHPRNTLREDPFSCEKKEAKGIPPEFSRARENLHPAFACKTLDELRQTMIDFRGCSLRNTAMNFVFSDGNPRAPLMLVGEAPGADEDRQGLPFVGQSGQLLDRILAAIHRDRTQVYISNVIPWRPPGNRPPTTEEIALCQPFIEKHIELVNPKILVLLGGVAAKTLLSTTEGIVKLRGKWRTYVPSCGNPLPEIQTICTFHPAYLLRSPSQKAHVWKDFLAIEQALEAIMP